MTFLWKFEILLNLLEWPRAIFHAFRYCLDCVITEKKIVFAISPTLVPPIHHDIYVYISGKMLPLGLILFDYIFYPVVVTSLFIWRSHAVNLCNKLFQSTLNDSVNNIWHIPAIIIIVMIVVRLHHSIPSLNKYCFNVFWKRWAFVRTVFTHDNKHWIYTINYLNSNAINS